MGTTELAERKSDGTLSEHGPSDDFDEDWERGLAAAPPVKDPMTRLLDLLAGWSKLAEGDAFPDSEDVLSRIADLYQEAGQFAFDPFTEVDREARIREFLLESILPVLMAR